jgi:hypothetical protein
VNRVRRERHGFGRFRERLAGNVGGDPAQDLDESRGTRIDHACLPEHLELVLRPRDRGVSVLDQRMQKLGQPFVAARLGLVGQRPDHRQDRPFDGLANRRPGRVGAAPQRGRHGTVLIEALDGATDDLREDHAGVAASAEQRSVRDIGLPCLERLAHGAYREQHVRPRVAVGHRIDVEVVETGPVAIERGLGRAGELEHASALGH